MDYKDKYRLVIATPNSPTKFWSEVDDAYLQNIVDLVYEQVGKENIKAFWLVGHSQGGMTSNRIVRTDFFKSRVDGWLSLSGGRLGGNPGRGSTFGPPRTPASGSNPAPAAAPALKFEAPKFEPPKMEAPKLAPPALAAPKGKLEAMVPILLVVNTFLLIVILLVVVFAMKGK